MRLRQRGFTLLEALIVLAITGVIIWPMAMATTTLLRNPQRVADQDIVLQQVQNAGRWISRDVQMTGNVTANAQGFPLTLSIPIDDNPANNYSIDYVFDGSKLKRNQYNSSHTLVSQTLIADYIVTSNATAFSTIGSRLYKLTIRAAKGSAVVTMSYEVSQRL